MEWPPAGGEHSGDSGGRAVSGGGPRGFGGARIAPAEAPVREVGSSAGTAGADPGCSRQRRLPQPPGGRPLSPFPVQMQNHWLPEPGADPARQRLMWFMLFSGQPQVAELAGMGQAHLSELPGLDLVPRIAFVRLAQAGA